MMERKGRHFESEDCSKGAGRRAVALLEEARLEPSA